MNKFLAWILIVVIALFGCSMVPQDKEYVRPEPTPIQQQKGLSDLDPDDGIQEVVMALGTDDLLFGPQSVEYYLSGMESWVIEISKRFEGDFIVFLSHGMDVDGVWVCEYSPDKYYPVDYIVLLLRKQLGERNLEIPIVLIVCNQWDFDITVDKNTWYGKENIFIFPDSSLDPEMVKARQQMLLDEGETAIGSFDKFITNKNLR